MATAPATMRLIGDDPPQFPPVERTASADGGLFGFEVAESLDSILITTAQFDAPGPRIVFVSPAFSRMMGYQAEELIGRTPLLFEGPKTDRDDLRRLHEQMAAGESFFGEALFYRKDGSECAVELRVYPIRDHRGGVACLVQDHRHPGPTCGELNRLVEMVRTAQRTE